MTEMNQDKLEALNLDELESVSGGAQPQYEGCDSPIMKSILIKRMFILRKPCPECGQIIDRPQEHTEWTRIVDEHVRLHFPDLYAEEDAIC